MTRKYGKLHARTRVPYAGGESSPEFHHASMAHNGHAAAAAPPEAQDDTPMGGHLRQYLGNAMVSCGFMFDQGSFRAVDMATGQIRTFTVNAPPLVSIDSTQAGLGIPLFAVDLRGAPGWFGEPHYSRQIGGGFSGATPGGCIKSARHAISTC